MQSHVSLRHYQKADRHRHEDHHQLVIALQGQMSLDLDTHNDTVTTSQAVLVPKGALHSFQADSTARFLVADLAGDLLPLGLSERSAADAFFPLTPGLRHLCHYIESEMNSGGSLPQAIAFHVAGLLSTTVDGFRRRPQVVAKAIHILESQPTRPWTLTSLARETGLSPSTLLRRFKQETGETPMEFQARLRLEHAHRLLLSSGLGLAQIAFEVGYSDQSAFTRAFQRHFGDTPGRLRRAALRLQ